MTAAPAVRVHPVARLRAIPWWGRVLLLFAASRVVTTVLFLWVQSQATTQSRAGANPTLLTLATAWDGAWYQYIAAVGYPSTLPVTASGAVDTNQWAFLPVYPYLVKLLTFGVLPWPLTAVLVSVAAGFGAAVLLALLLKPHIGESAAVFASAVFAVSPLAFMLQTAYAESLGLLWLLAALVLIDRDRPMAAIVPALLLAFTRPGVLALALTVAVRSGVRLVQWRRGGAPVPAKAITESIALAAVCTAAGFAWAGIAAAATGRLDAYFVTEGAWRALWLPSADIELFTPWWFAARFWTELWVGAGAAVWAAPLLLVILIGGFGVALFTPPVRRLGPTVRLWAASWALYLLAVFFPQSSVLRLLMPMAPLAGALTPTRAAPRALVIVACVGLQALWLWVCYGPFQTYWSVP